MKTPERDTLSPRERAVRSATPVVEGLDERWWDYFFQQGIEPNPSGITRVWKELLAN